MDLLSQLFGSPVPAITPTELQEKLKAAKRPFVLDVRQPEEFREAHISGAKLIPLGELKNHLADLPKEREIVAVCASGSRSTSAAKILSGAGYQVLNMRGGMSAWQREKLPVKKGMAS
ncbi:MAG: rhodanese-like domain-containing protein [Chloroflexi bacterium]|nr:rhodanese-like domain-containing protein [Chloroflexota bacterium]